MNTAQLNSLSYRVERSKSLVLRFREVALPRPAEIDLVVDAVLPLTVVSVAEVTPLLEARMIGRLKNGGWSSGLLLNFGEKQLSQGIRRLSNPSWRRG